MAEPINQLFHSGIWYKSFVRMDGLNDLYQARDGHVYKQVQGELVCAWKNVQMDANGKSPRGLAECVSTPRLANKCNHVLTPAMESLLMLWRGTRISLCRFRLTNLLPDLTKPNVKRVFEWFKHATCPDLVVDFDILYKRYEGGIKHLRKNNGKPWGSAIDINTEVRKMQLDCPEYANLFRDFEEELRDEARIFVQPPPPEEEEDEDVNLAREAIQEVVTLRREGVLRKVIYEVDIGGGQIKRRRL